MDAEMAQKLHLAKTKGLLTTNLYKMKMTAHIFPLTENEEKSALANKMPFFYKSFVIFLFVQQCQQKQQQK